MFYTIIIISAAENTKFGRVDLYSNFRLKKLLYYLGGLRQQIKSNSIK